MDIEEGQRPRVVTGGMQGYQKCLLIFLGIGLLTMVIVLPLSFSGVEYYELGIRKQKSTGNIKLDKVYTGGRHLIGPDYTFKKFEATVHYEELKKIATFTKGTADSLGVAVEITCAMQYFLRPEDLKDLHQQYDLYYKPVVRTTANAAIKGRAAELSVSQFIRDRETVETELFKAVKRRLEGTCCLKDCAAKKACVPGCVEYSKCTTSQKGLFVEVRYFQFLDFDIHDDVKKKYFERVKEVEQKQQAQFDQDEKVVRKETERMKNEINNAAAEIAQNSSAQATVILAKAKAEALLKVEKARDTGLSYIYQQLNITKEAQKSAFNYLRTLRGQQNVKLNVGYQTLMARD